MTELVRAGGGVVWRRSDEGLEVVLVHRPRYDDWSFPKGKAQPGESDEDAALREVEEETGLRCALGTELATASYNDRNGRPKRVRYWTMQTPSGELRPTGEIDEARWLALADARQTLTYEHDRTILDALPALLESRPAG